MLIPDINKIPVQETPKFITKEKYIRISVLHLDPCSLQMFVNLLNKSSNKTAPNHHEISRAY